MLLIMTAVVPKPGNGTLQTVSLLAECSGPVNHITSADLSSSDKDVCAHHDVLDQRMFSRCKGGQMPPSKAVGHKEKVE